TPLRPKNHPAERRDSHRVLGLPPLAGAKSRDRRALRRSERSPRTTQPCRRPGLRGNPGRASRAMAAQRLDLEVTRRFFGFGFFALSCGLVSNEFNSVPRLRDVKPKRRRAAAVQGAARLRTAGTCRRFSCTRGGAKAA